MGAQVGGCVLLCSGGVLIMMTTIHADNADTYGPCLCATKIHQSAKINFLGKIALHLLFGWSLDKDKKCLDQSKQFS